MLITKNSRGLHDRLVDRQPAGQGFTETGKVIVTNVSGCVQICIQGEVALLALEDALAPPVGPGRVPAPTALLAGVARTDEVDKNSRQIGLVEKESSQSGKTPGMEPPSLFLFFHERGSECGSGLPGPESRLP